MGVLRVEGEGANVVHARHGIEQSEGYLGSPIDFVFKNAKPLRRRLTDLDTEHDHSVLRSIARAGGTDYLASPLRLSDGGVTVLIYAARAADGFKEDEIRERECLADYLAPVIEVDATRQLAVSRRQEFHRHVVQRLRRFHRAHRVAFDQPDVERPQPVLRDGGRGGDGARRISGQDELSAACEAALEAADDAFSALDALDHRRLRTGLPQLSFGVGLHVGEVIYGNVGMPDRLDFTVMGTAVNRTARLKSLTKTVNVPLLLSAESARQVDRPVRSVGLHAMKGVGQPRDLRSRRTPSLTRA